MVYKEKSRNGSSTHAFSARLTGCIKELELVRSMCHLATLMLFDFVGLAPHQERPRPKQPTRSTSPAVQMRSGSSNTLKALKASKSSQKRQKTAEEGRILAQNMQFFLSSCFWLC